MDVLLLLVWSLAWGSSWNFVHASQREYSFLDSATPDLGSVPGQAALVFTACSGPADGPGFLSSSTKLGPPPPTTWGGWPSSLLPTSFLL